VRIPLSSEFLSLYCCLAVVWLAFAVASHLAYRRLGAEKSIHYWSLAWYCAFSQLALFLVARIVEPSSSRIFSFALLIPNQIIGYLQPAFVLLAAWSTYRLPSRQLFRVAVAGSLAAATASVVAVTQVRFTNEAEVLRFLLTPKVFLLSSATVWFGVAYSRMAQRRSGSHFSFAIPLSCGLQAIHQFLIGVSHLTDGAVYFQATSLPAALIGIVIGVLMVLSLFFELTEAAQRHNQAKSAFLSTVTHELRTPLAGLIGLTSMLSQGRPASEKDEIIVSIGQCAGSVLALVDDILDVARIEEGGTTVTLAPVALLPLIEGVVSMFSLSAAEKGVLLETVYETSLPLGVTTDATLFNRILLNLVGNALKFTNTGSVQVRVAYSADRLRIAVADTGCGIPAADLSHLMQQFYQASNAVAASSRGTGLGLFLSRELVRLLGGSGIEVQSELGVGSTFTFTVVAPEAAPAPAVVPTAAAAPLTESLRVLVAEDNKVNRLVLVRMLERLGHRTVIAADGQEAVERWRSERPDLILMDYRMPKLDGLGATREIRELEARGDRVPIVAVTANALEEHRHECLAAGMDDYLAKPFTLQQLAAMLEQHRP
jgi:two-component system, sensor histidine kinase